MAGLGADLEGWEAAVALAAQRVPSQPEAAEQAAGLREDPTMDVPGPAVAIPPLPDLGEVSPREQVVQAVRAREARLQTGWRPVAGPGADRPDQEEAGQDKVGAAAALALVACQLRREVVHQPQAPEQVAAVRERPPMVRSDLAAILPQRDPEAALLLGQAVKVADMAAVGWWVACQVSRVALEPARGVR